MTYALILKRSNVMQTIQSAYLHCHFSWTKLEKGSTWIPEDEMASLPERVESLAKFHHKLHNSNSHCAQ